LHCDLKSSCPFGFAQGLSRMESSSPNEKETSHEQGVVANTLKSFRNGAVRFIDWLERVCMSLNNA